MLKYKIEEQYKKLPLYGKLINDAPLDDIAYARNSENWINISNLINLEINLTQLKNKNYSSLTEALAEQVDNKVKGIQLTFFTGTEWKFYIYKGDVWNVEENWDEFLPNPDLSEVINLTINNASNIELHLKYDSEDITLNYIDSELTFKIPSGVNYTIEFPDVEGFKKPENLTGLSLAGNVKFITVEYKKSVINVIHIDQTISDPDSMITGNVNGEVIQWIRQNSHRVLAKKTAEGEMAYYPLDDTNSNKYADGSEAKLDGTEGDVMLMLPTFYYKGTEGDQVDLMFSDAPFEDAIKWDRNILIGVYESYNNGNKCYSRSGVQSTGDVSQANWKSYASARGQGYQLVDWQMHCVLGCLYYAMYGNTDCQSTIGKGTNSYQKINGETDALGMTDTVAGGNGDSGSINFWGLENWWGNKYEWMEEDQVNPSSKQFTVYDPVTKGTRNIPFKYFNGWYVKKMKFGRYLDLINTEDDDQRATDSTSYCDYQYWPDSGSTRVVLRSGNNSYSGGGVAYAGAGSDSSYTGSSFGSRLAFRGECTEAESVSTFKSLPIIN